MSLFDTPAFNERLFFPRPDTSPPPPGAIDLDVPGEVVLHVRWHRVRAELPTLLLFHGNGEVVADYDDAAAHFAEAGANLAVMDFRGYGRSGGEPTLRAIIGDAARVVAAVRERAAAPLIVMGRSLGSACAAELYARGGVAGVVLESGFVDLAALIRRRGLAVPVLSPDDRAAFDPLPKLAAGQGPLLVLHGAGDTLISADEARRAHAAAGTTRKRLVIVPHRGHNDVSLSPVYWEALAAFVSEVGRGS